MVPPGLRRLASAMHRLPKPLILALSVALLGLVVHLDELAGPHMPLSLFYVVPIALVTWYVGGGWGVLFAVVGGCMAYFYSFHRIPISFSPMMMAWGLFTRIASFAVTTALIWWLRRALENQRALANTDELTGIQNARAFRAAAAAEIARAERQGEVLSAVFIDCDNFKGINDRHGHATGDALLRLIADTMVAHVRLTDHVGRLGGDEFGILLPGADAEACRSIAGKLNSLLLEAVRARNWPVTFSAGAATFHAPPANVDALLKTIDRLQYQAKLSGKDRLAHEVVERPEAAPALAA